MRISGLIAALLLAGCSGAPEDAPSTNVAAPASEGTEVPAGGEPANPASGEEATARPPLDDGMRWHFSRSVEGPKLAFGEPATDNVRLMLRCPSGGGSVVLSFTRPADIVAARPIEATLASGGSEARLDVDSRESALGGRLVEATIALDSAPIRRFRDRSALTLRWGEERIAVPAAGADGRRFFEACGPF